ncbi:MAG TPA: protein kinase [Gemmatimonadaceae bacterium]|nr:protein kinase [Gemmatimonadaceae bacterium]
MLDAAGLAAAIAARYRIEREIGRGGMATVYLADDLRHGRKVAIKVLAPQLAMAVGSERFLREIQIAAQVSHPHIVPLYDSGESEGFLYYVMPFVDGESLRQRLDRERQLPVDDALAITRDVAAALQYAHARNVVHRDIKPENILLYTGEALLADFGIALAVSAATERRITGTGLVVGTPQYMSPEQALSEGTDARSDLYSLGCVLYEMLAGEPPYTGPTVQSIIMKRLVDPVPSIRRLRPEVPANVDEALTKAMAKLPADRFASVADFVKGLSAPPAGRARASCVAVLPFVNLSADPDNEYFADGITEDVIAHLSKIRALKVISRTSVMPFRNREQSLVEIGAKLGATSLLEGSVRRAGNRVRIVAQLIDATTDRHVWAETYDRALDDIFAIQTDVALHIASALKAELSGDERARVRKEPTRDLEAYQLFLQGQRWLVKYTPTSINQAIEYFRRATDHDPRFALAYSNIALAYTELLEHGAVPPETAYRNAAEAAATALRLDPELGTAHCTIGYLKTVHEFDWAGAEASYKRALELNPNDAEAYDLYGRMLGAVGRYDEALVMVERAQELDPLAHRLDVATTLLRAGRYDQAVASAEHAAELDPGHDRARATLGWAYFLRGDHERGLRELEQAAAFKRGDTLWLGQLGEAYGLAGKTEEAREILHELEERSRHAFVSPYHLAYVYTGLGDKDRAIDWLERAVAERTGPAYGIKGSFLFTPLRDHPRFRALLRQMNLD